MKRLGIIGGTGPESTIDYYRSIVGLYRERQPDGSYPPVLDLKRVFDLVGGGELDRLADYLFDELERLVRAGAEYAAFAANMPHIVFDAVERRVSIPLVSIVRATLDAASQRGFKRLAILGPPASIDFHSQ